MVIKRIRINRFFGVARRVHRQWGPFTDFGFEGEGLVVYKARLDGHPELSLGNYNFCVATAGERDWNAFAYSLPGESTPRTRESATTAHLVLYAVLAALSTGTLLVLIGHSTIAGGSIPIFGALVVAPLSIWLFWSVISTGLRIRARRALNRIG